MERPGELRYKRQDTPKHGDGSHHIGGGGSGRGDNCSYQQMESQRCEMVDGKMQCTKTRTELRKCPGRRTEKKEGGRWVETDESEFGIGGLGGALDLNFDSFFGQIRDHLSGMRRNNPSVFDDQFPIRPRPSERREQDYSEFFPPTGRFPSFSHSFKSGNGTGRDNNNDNHRHIDPEQIFDFMKHSASRSSSQKDKMVRRQQPKNFRGSSFHNDVIDEV
mmetsp:Transcript_11225/g.18344  ORF Transcript_11225/g.18344 Transcript_11225/m.18344 type:complete len:219 (-) Transcript_11225:110-766(-)|eukprot:jgi/Bigna1/88717/estExt_fgenesh1_pg.C_370042